MFYQLLSRDPTCIEPDFCALQAVVIYAATSCGQNSVCSLLKKPEVASMVRWNVTKAFPSLNRILINSEKHVMRNKSRLVAVCFIGFYLPVPITRTESEKHCCLS